MKAYEMWGMTTGKGERIAITARGAHGEIRVSDPELPPGTTVRIDIHVDPDDPRNRNVVQDLNSMPSWGTIRLEATDSPDGATNDQQP